MMRVFDVVGRPAMVMHEPVLQPRHRQLLPDGRAVGVVAHGADQQAARAQRGDVGGDVGGAAQRGVALAHGHDRDRRLGAQPLGLADEVAVEHDVADHHDATLLHLLDQLQHAVARERCRRCSHRRTPRWLMPSVA